MISELLSELVVFVHNKAIKRVALANSKICIGRHKECDIILTDKTVSLQHAQIITVGSDCFLKDLQSTNGTFVNRCRVKCDILEVGDVITIGKYCILYKKGKAAKNSKLNNFNIASPISENYAYLVVQNGERKGEIIPIVNKGITLGQPDQQQIMIAKHRLGYYEMRSIQQHSVQRSQYLQPGDMITIGDVRMKFTRNER